MHRMRSLFAASALAGTALLVLPSAPADAVNGPGAGVMDLTFTFDTPIPGNQCIDTGFTVDGTVKGVITLGTQVLRGTFDVDGVKGTGGLEFCQAAANGEMLIWGTLTGTDDGGHVVDCAIGGIIERIDVVNNPGGIRGNCTVDGVDAGELSIGGEGVQPGYPVLGSTGTTTSVEVITQFTQKIIVL